jgi:uncharacterized protein (TIGR02594 family)
MRLNQKRAAIILWSVTLAVAAGSADANPAHKRHAATQVSVQAAASAVDQDQRYRFLANEAGAGRERAAVRSPGRHKRASRDRRLAAQSHANSAYGGPSTNALVTEARKYIGTNPTGRGSLWCGAFMDLVLKRTGHGGGGNLASAYAHYGTRVAGPQVGAIAVMGRRGGGHVGVVSGVDANGNPIIVSGNHNHTVAESVYPARRISAYVLPGG